MDGFYQISSQGGPEVLEWHNKAPNTPAAKDVLIRHTLPLPSRLGVEAVGHVEAVGSSVTRVKVGDRVGYAMGMGAYGESNLVNEAFVVRLPQSINDETAAAVLLKGLTVSYLLRKTHKLTSDDTILVHAAAGGVGLLLCQWANHIGATFVNVAYDSVGAATYERSLNSLAPLGKFISYGSASGKIPAVDPHDLQTKGSLFFTRPSLAHYATPPAALDDLATSLFQAIDTGALEVHIKQRYGLSDLKQAHVDLEARATTGSTVILPNL